jgi:hypothetical protein
VARIRSVPLPLPGTYIAEVAPVLVIVPLAGVRRERERDRGRAHAGDGVSPVHASPQCRSATDASKVETRSEYVAMSDEPVPSVPRCRTCSCPRPGVLREARAREREARRELGAREERPRVGRLAPGRDEGLRVDDREPGARERARPDLDRRGGLRAVVARAAAAAAGGPEQGDREAQDEAGARRAGPAAGRGGAGGQGHGEPRGRDRPHPEARPWSRGPRYRGYPWGDRSPGRE